MTIAATPLGRTKTTLQSPLTDPQAWATAPCAQTDPELFFPDKGASARPAKQVCSTCPIREQCLDWALSTGEDHGIWGGLTQIERRKIVRSRKGLPQLARDHRSAA